jgi:hypothetical protein
LPSIYIIRSSSFILFFSFFDNATTYSTNYLFSVSSFSSFGWTCLYAFNLQTVDWWGWFPPMEQSPLVWSKSPVGPWWGSYWWSLCDDVCSTGSPILQHYIDPLKPKLV